MLPAAALPSRIVCLTEEPTEVLYALGEQHRIVGISGFTVRLPQARREKPRIAAFTSARIDRILGLEPDLVVGFSDMQADIACDLLRLGVEVWISNHRSVAGILGYVRRLGAMVGADATAKTYVETQRAGMSGAQLVAARLRRRPRVYFEEWDQPQISAIGWVSELIDRTDRHRHELIDSANGHDILPELARCAMGRDRIVADPQRIVALAPDIIIGSWCGKKFSPERVAARPDWGNIPAVRNGHLYEIKSPIILQPGPAALTDGLTALQRIVTLWARHSQNSA
ncbi:MAG: ABC transporter substrate-binding protein [Acidobacteriaceae bacterium]